MTIKKGSSNMTNIVNISIIGDVTLYTSSADAESGTALTLTNATDYTPNDVAAVLAEELVATGKISAQDTNIYYVKVTNPVKFVGFDLAASAGSKAQFKF